MKFKNHTPSHKVKNNSKSLLSSTIEYIKNDLKNENSNIEKINKNSKTYLYENYENGKINKKSNSNSNNTEINTFQEQINQKQSKS